MSEVHLSDNIEAYEAMREELERDHTGLWVVVHDRKLLGIFADFEAAADAAVDKFGRGPYHIRQVGVAPPHLSSSMLYRVLS
ncbi:MAG: hypothetical protein F4Y69_00570 [Chloroflexi bacterium]|nr:hypothetical protein [Chloroflexota bacterium]MYF21147.1 hypothetical protein [Chloroflexota bacterium]